MNIAGIDYNLNYRALEVYLSGCDGFCDGCHNKELFDYSVGKEWYHYGKVFRQKLSTGMVHHIWVMGGEPLLQNIYDLEFFLKWVSQFKKQIMLWTRFYDVPDNLKKYLDYIKIGEYQKDSDSYIEPLFGIELASKNQKITKVEK